MATLLLEVKLSGKGKILQHSVTLEDIALTLFTIDGGKTWTDSDIDVQIDKDLDVKLVCKSLGKVGWDFFIKDQITGKKLYEVSGTTGDSGVNRSEREKSIPMTLLPSPNAPLDTLSAND